MRFSKDLSWLTRIFKPVVDGDEKSISIPDLLRKGVTGGVDVLGGLRWNEFQHGSGTVTLAAGPPLILSWNRGFPVDFPDGDLIVMPYASVTHSDGVAPHTLQIGFRAEAKDIITNQGVDLDADEQVFLTRPLIFNATTRPIFVAVDGVGLGAMAVNYSFFVIRIGEYVKMIAG